MTALKSINACQAAGGGTVVFGAKSYAIGTGLTANSRVSFRGQGRDVTVLLATAAIRMLLWPSTLAGSFSGGFIEHMAFDGDGVATAGLVVGICNNHRITQVHIEMCVDWLVLCGTQNSLFDSIFVQYCSHANLYLAGAAWNNTFMRLGTNQPDNGGYHLLSDENSTYYTLCGVSAPSQAQNRHNTYFHPIMERGSPANIVRLAGDGGDNAFYDAEWQSGSSGNPQVYISSTSSNNVFARCIFQRGSSVASFAVQTSGFNTRVLYSTGTGWAGIPWISVASPGSVVEYDTGSGGSITDGSARSLQISQGFVGGRLHYNFFDKFFLAPIGADGEVGWADALMYIDGRISPVQDAVHKLGSSTKRWLEVNSKWIAATRYETAASTFASLSSATTGDIAHVSDSNTNTLGATVAAGGALHVLAWYNGSAWKVIGG